MEIKYEYGGCNRSWYSTRQYDTVEEAIAGCVKSWMNQIMKGFTPDKNVCIWQIEYNRTTDEFGVLEYSTRTRRIMMVDDDVVKKIDFVDIITKEFNKAMSFCMVTDDDIFGIRCEIESVHNIGYITESEAKSLMAMIDENPIRKIVSGDFAEGQVARVNIDGKCVDRKVRYSREAGDLYVVMDNKRYFLCEFN